MPKKVSKRRAGEKDGEEVKGGGKEREKKRQRRRGRRAPAKPTPARKEGRVAGCCLLTFAPSLPSCAVRFRGYFALFFLFLGRTSRKKSR